jgi:hypothetical protein
MLTTGVAHAGMSKNVREQVASVMNSTCIHLRAKSSYIYMYRRGRIYKDPTGEIQ